MTYKHSHLLNWLKSHDCISLSCLEKKAYIPKDSLRHFIKERRDLSIKHFDSLENILFDYGYKSLNE